MHPSPFARTNEVRTDRTSDVPIALDLSGMHHQATGSVMHPLAGWTSRIPASWIGMSGYLVAGVVLGLVLIVTLSLTRNDSSNTKASAGVITDNIVHLRGREIAEQCWRGTSKDEPARMTVSLEVGLDGKVRNAVAAGESAPMRSCIEAFVKAWEFLPQATSSQMVLPFEVEAR
jgi:hypothetical protein